MLRLKVLSTTLHYSFGLCRARNGFAHITHVDTCMYKVLLLEAQFSIDHRWSKLRRDDPVSFASEKLSSSAQLYILNI